MTHAAGGNWQPHYAAAISLNPSNRAAGAAAISLLADSTLSLDPDGRYINAFESVLVDLKM